MQDLPPKRKPAAEATRKLRRKKGEGNRPPRHRDGWATRLNALDVNGGHPGTHQQEHDLDDFGDDVGSEGAWQGMDAGEGADKGGNPTTVASVWHLRGASGGARRETVTDCSQLPSGWPRVTNVDSVHWVTVRAPTRVEKSCQVMPVLVPCHADLDAVTFEVKYPLEEYHSSEGGEFESAAFEDAELGVVGGSFAHDDGLSSLFSQVESDREEDEYYEVDTKDDETVTQWHIQLFECAEEQGCARERGIRLYGAWHGDYGYAYLSKMYRLVLGNIACGACRYGDNERGSITCIACSLPLLVTVETHAKQVYFHPANMEHRGMIHAGFEALVLTGDTKMPRCVVEIIAAFAALTTPQPE
jgi:hypothetical protein